MLGDRAQPLERAADEPRDVHLGDADALGDLGLREVLDEAQVQHDAVARRQRLQRRRDRGAVLDELEAVVLDPDRLGVGLAVALVAEAVGLERDGVVGGRGLHRLEHGLGGGVERLRDLLGRGRAAELARHVLDAVVDLHHALLHPARDVHGPAVVAEVALELAEHGRHRVGRERGLARGIEAIDRLDQAERRDLDEVVERLVGAPVPARHSARQRQQPLDELFACGLITVPVVADEEATIFLSP